MDVRQAGAGLGQHVRRVVQAGDRRPGVREPLDQGLGGVSGSAAEIDNPSWGLCEWDLGEQVLDGPVALGCELEVLRCGPVRK